MNLQQQIELFLKNDLTYCLLVSVVSLFMFVLFNTFPINGQTLLLESANLKKDKTNYDSNSFNSQNVGFIRWCSETNPPKTEVACQITFMNTGEQPITSLSIIEPIPDNADYKLNSTNHNIGETNLVFITEYSSDFDFSNPKQATWNYIPQSGGGGASENFDCKVKAIRWQIKSGILSNASPSNTAGVSFITKSKLDN